MFGLVRPCYKLLEKQDKNEYRCYYCGLCMGMGRCTGLWSRVVINHDVCLAYLVADAIYTETELIKARCPFAPYRKVAYRDNTALLNKMSEINYILTYHKVLDDVVDDNSLKAKIVERLMRNRYDKTANRNKQATEAVISGMAAIHEMESNMGYVPIKDAAVPFGFLLENVMQNCLEDPVDSEVFSLFCKHLGMWIYVVDACLDMQSDAAHSKYNPILAGQELKVEIVMAERKDEITTFLINCKQSMQQLLELLACTKNKELIYQLLEHMLPQEVAKML